MRLYHTPQDGMPFKTQGLFTSGIFHLLFFEPKAMESEAMDEEVEGQLS